MEGSHISARPCAMPCLAALASNISAVHQLAASKSQLPEVSCGVDMQESMHTSMAHDHRQL